MMAMQIVIAWTPEQALQLTQMGFEERRVLVKTCPETSPLSCDATPEAAQVRAGTEQLLSMRQPPLIFVVAEARKGGQ